MSILPQLKKKKCKGSDKQEKIYKGFYKFTSNIVSNTFSKDLLPRTQLIMLGKEKNDCFLNMVLG